MEINVNNLVQERNITGEDSQETKELFMMLKNAKTYIRSFGWCPEISESYLGFGIGGVISVFLFHLSEKINGVDDWIWVVEGDVPSAYMVVENVPDPASALKVYCDLMEDWIQAVVDNKSLENVFPVSAPANHEHAEMLSTRISYIKNKIIPQCGKMDEDGRGSNGG